MAAADDPGGLRGAREGELPLGYTDAALPWLEADDEDGFESGGTGRLIGVVAAILALLALTAVGIWFALHRGRAAAAGDGSVIAAPEGPYKVRPSDAGGIVARGIDDTSYRVAEGRSVRAGQQVGADARAAGAEGAVIGVQVGAYANEAEANAAWPVLVQRFTQLAGLSHRVVEERADFGSVFGLQALTQSADAARTLCGELRTGGLNCRVRQ